MVKRFNIYKEGNFKTISDLHVRFLAPSDMKYIETPNRTFWMFIGEMIQGNKCLGLIKDETVLSYLWVNFKYKENYGIKALLKPNECCLYTAETKPEERGKGYAEILRAKTYEILKKQGIDTFYSFSDIKNKSAIRFKEKIGAEIIGSYKYVKIFNYKHISYDKR